MDPTFETETGSGSDRREKTESGFGSDPQRTTRIQILPNFDLINSSFIFFYRQKSQYNLYINNVL